MSANSDHLGAENPEATLEYWTEERMSRALPLEPPPVELPSEEAPSEIDTSALPAQTDASEGPDSAATIALREELPEAFATQLVSNPDQYPQRTAGKLFMRVNNEDRFGSAAVIQRSGILTAAHCVCDPNYGWATMVAFAPAFDKAPNPNYGGVWPVGRGFVPKQWPGPPAAVEYDFSFCQVSPMQGRVIGDVVGWVGIIVNRPDIRLWHDLGYPGVPIPNFAFDGLRMWNCTGDYRQSAGFAVFKDGNFTGGSSGGPWLVQTQQGLNVNGVQSWSLGNPPTQNASPYFRADVMTLFNEAFGG